MMKKILSLLSAVVLAFPLFQITVNAASAEQLPFTLTAPEHVAINCLNDEEYPSKCQVAWSKNASMSDWSNKMSDPETQDAAVKALNKMGYDDLFYTAQMDWSIDSTEDWHYNEYWDTECYNGNYVKYHLGEWAYTYFQNTPEITNTDEVFQYLGDISDPEHELWYGRHADGEDVSGWKDVLKEGQYIVVDSAGQKNAYLNLTDHTVNVRMRWLVTGRRTDGNEVKIGSDWSEIVSVGKGAAPAGAAVRPGDLSAPVIRDLRYANQRHNDCPVVAFYLDVPDAVAKALNDAKAADGDIQLITEARVRDGEWKNLAGDWELKFGEMKAYLSTLPEEQGSIPKNTPLELRCCYECWPRDGENSFRTEYSNVLGFTAKEKIKYSTGAVPTHKGTDNDCLGPDDTYPGSESEKSMGWLGVLLIMLAVFVLFIILLLVTRSKKQDNKK